MLARFRKANSTFRCDDPEYDLALEQHERQMLAQQEERRLRGIERYEQSGEDVVRYILAMKRLFYWDRFEKYPHAWRLEETWEH